MRQIHLDMLGIDLEKLENQIKEVVAYSQGIDINKINGVKPLLDQWYENKKYLIRKFKFDDQLIMRSDDIVTFEIDDAAKQRHISDFCDRLESHYGLEELSEFVSNLGIKSFYENIIKEPYPIWGTTKSIHVGAKVIKSFKYFVDNKDVLRAVQDEASMLIQENKVSGHLCISVHPLDYLSSSENTYKWRSCHALDGDYRAGNLDYIADESTIVCYLEGERDVKLPNFPDSVPWNSKKWRMLLNISRYGDYAFASRQYPFFSEIALEEIKKRFLPILFGMNLTNISDWHNDLDNDYNFHYKRAVPDPMEERYPWYRSGYRTFFIADLPLIDTMVIQPMGRLHYNDYLESTIYEKPYYIWASSFNPKPIRIGEKHVKCLCCGEKDIIDPSSMICEDCYTENEEIVYCSCCERRIYGDSPVMWDGTPICEDCAEKYTAICETCGKRHYLGNMFKLKRLEKYVCSNCEYHNAFANFIDVKEIE